MTLTVTPAPRTQSLVTVVPSSASYLPAPLVASSHRPPVLPILVPDLSQKVIAFTLPQLLILTVHPRPCPQSSHYGVTSPCSLFSQCTLALTPGYCAAQDTAPASASHTPALWPQFYLCPADSTSISLILPSHPMALLASLAFTLLSPKTEVS